MEPQPLLTQKEERISTLQSLIDAGQLNQWMYELVRPYIKGNVLEIWSGEGNMSALLVQNGLPLRISDPHRRNHESLKKRFDDQPIIKGIHRIDLYNPDFETIYDGLLGKFDTVLLLNAIENGANDPMLWKNAKKLLWERGRLIVLLAAQTILFEESGEGFKELYRWNRSHIKTLLGKESKLLHFFSVYEMPRSKSINLYHQQVPFFQATEDMSCYRTGLNIIAVARK
jgi:hypothetical protein